MMRAVIDNGNHSDILWGEEPIRDVVIESTSEPLRTHRSYPSQIYFLTFSFFIKVFLLHPSEYTSLTPKETYQESPYARSPEYHVPTLKKSLPPNMTSILSKSVGGMAELV
ncbi:hypothetical protein AB4K20DRAFT_1872098 [Rhizopus microsporus]